MRRAGTSSVARSGSGTRPETAPLARTADVIVFAVAAALVWPRLVPLPLVAGVFTALTAGSRLLWNLSLVRYAEGLLTLGPAVQGARMVRAHLGRGIRLDPALPVMQGSMVALLYHGMHYIRQGNGREQVFAIDTDPAEVRDLAAEPGGGLLLQHVRAVLVRTLAASRPGGTPVVTRQ